MMTNFFEVCKKIDELQPLLKDKNIFKVFSFGEAPQGVKSPYIVYQTVSGAPRYAINHKISFEKVNLQIDIYALVQIDALQIYKIIKNSLPNSFLISRYNGMSRELDTRLFRISFDLDYIGD